MPETHETQAAQQLHKPNQPTKKQGDTGKANRKPEGQSRAAAVGGTSTLY